MLITNVTVAYNTAVLNFENDIFHISREHLRGKYHCTIDLLYDWFGNVPLCSTKFCASSA